MTSFDPHSQDVNFLASDGVTPVSINIANIDSVNEESVSICLNTSLASAF